MKLKFEFETKDEEEAATHFLTWLCEQGEQDYWQWMEMQDVEPDGPHVIVRFNYDWKKLESKCELGDGEVDPVEEEDDEEAG